MSGIRELNSLLYLGKVAYYRCTNPAVTKIIQQCGYNGNFMTTDIKYVQV